MNIKTIQKHYDKLTAAERFSLLMAAVNRGDDADRQTLLQTAPRKTYSIPTTWGLGRAFEQAADWYIMQQLGNCAAFYYLIINETEPAQLETIQRNFLTMATAWREICAEYGADSNHLIDGLPYTAMIDLTEITIQAGNDDAPLDLPGLPDNKNALRELIETLRKDWE